MIIDSAKCIDCGNYSQFCRKEKPSGKFRCPSCFVIAWIENRCTHVKGRWAGQSFKLLPWQIEDVIKPVFGTLKPNGYRQYKTIYIEIPKKNGKTELCSALALYCLTADGEQGGEVYSAAGEREQASLVYYPASKMVDNNKKLDDRLKVIDSRKRIVDYETNSFYQVLSSESYTKHGINPSAVFFDELHAQPNRNLYDVLTFETGVARAQQLIFIITTAGIHDPNSIGWEVHNYAMQVKDSVIEDPTFLPVIYAADEKDDWEDREVWRKCNPSLKENSPDHYVFVLDDFEGGYQKAKNNPLELNKFKRYRLNQWVGQFTRFIPMDHWDACDEKVDPELLRHRACYAGLDLSNRHDMTALVLVFPPENDIERYAVIPYFFVPEDTVLEKSKTDRAPYDMWVRSGLITATPGNTIDHGFVRKKINEIADKYDLREVAYDPWGSVQLAVQLDNEDGIPMVQHRQGSASMNAPTKELLAHIMQHRLSHGGHPVLRWNADNIAVKEGPSEDVRPVKEKSGGRIDGIIALIMALNIALLNADHKSQYGNTCSECRGVGEIDGEACWRCGGTGKNCVIAL